VPLSQTARRNKAVLMQSLLSLTVDFANEIFDKVDAIPFIIHSFCFRLAVLVKARFPETPE
jgi:hypothetical protein